MDWDNSASDGTVHCEYLPSDPGTVTVRWHGMIGAGRWSLTGTGPDLDSAIQAAKDSRLPRAQEQVA